MGTVTLFEDGRSAWLYRFAVRGPKQAVAEALYTTASNILRKLGHSQVLVYAPEGEQSLQERYAVLGFTKGNVYRAFWRNI
jgi:hypothetical protein